MVSVLEYLNAEYYIFILIGVKLKIFYRLSPFYTEYFEF